MIIFTYRFTGKTHCTKITQLVDRAKFRKADRFRILNRKILFRIGLTCIRDSALCDICGLNTSPARYALYPSTETYRSQKCSGVNRIIASSQRSRLQLYQSLSIVECPGCSCINHSRSKAHSVRVRSAKKEHRSRLYKT